MPNDYARISITLPPADLEAADRMAAAQDRSRSWIIAEAIRRYAADIEAEAERSPDMGISRRIQIGRDLELTAAERIRDAESVEVVGTMQRGGIEQPLRFANYAEFTAWRAKRRSSP
ncbi:MAG: hypothetical protein RLZZ621_1951 [Gemmatimonadota bacterium]|jgi:metal-responsive CopG/Arc/MetJ family transcriptional regulator